MTLEVADLAGGAWTDEAVQRHIDNLYIHGADLVELRQAPQLKDNSEPLPETGEVMMANNRVTEQELHNDALPTMPSIVTLVQPFLDAERTVIDSADSAGVNNLTVARGNYLLSIINDHQQRHGVAIPATTFHADLLRVEMCNFRGVSGNASFNLDALLRGAVFLVVSSNGNGKSTLLEAIFWCLYGKFLEPEVIAEEAIHTGMRSCSVTLHFRNGYIFTRSRAGKRPKFEISYRGTVVEQGHDAATTTQYLESHIVHMTSEIFRRTIVIADHASSAFLTVRDAQRAQSLDIMFGLDVLREYRGRVEEDFKKIKIRCNKVQADCDKVSEDLNRLASLSQRCLSDLEFLETNIGCKKTTIECMKTAIQSSRRKSEALQDHLKQKKVSVQKRRCTMDAMKGMIAKLQHDVELYQTMENARRAQVESIKRAQAESVRIAQAERVRTAQAERARRVQAETARMVQAESAERAQAENVKMAQAKIERYQVALAKEDDQQKHARVQVFAFVCQLSHRYLIPVINTMSYASAQIPWLSRFLTPALRKSLTRVTIWTSPPARVFSLDGLRKLTEDLHRTEALLYVLTEEISVRKSSLRHMEALVPETHEDEGEQSAVLGPVDDSASLSMDELELPQISQHVQRAEELLKFAEERHTRTQASLTADERHGSQMSHQIHETSCDIARQDGILEQMTRQKTSRSLEANQLMQQHKDLLRRQEKSMTERNVVEVDQALSTFWLAQLQDTATQKGPFITYCRAHHVHSLNVLIAQVLHELTQDAEGIATQHLDFQLQPDYTLEPIHGSLSMGKRSKGQKTRTYLALFLAMFQQTRSRLPFRTSFVFLDEVMDALDLQGIEALQRWLQRYVAARGMQAFLMTHRETSLRGNVIEVVRDRKRGTVYKLREEEMANPAT